MRLEDIKYQIQEKWISFMENPFFERIKSWYEALPKREQKLVKVVTIGVITVILFNVLYSLMARISDREDQIDDTISVIKKIDELNEFMIANEAELQKRKSNTLENKYVSLTDLVDKQQALAFIRPDSRVGEIKESLKKEVEGGKFYEGTADAKYNKITIRQLTKLLAGIEKNENMAKIASLKIARRTDDIKYIDAEFQIVTRTPK